MPEEIIFENTNNSINITKWYSIVGAPVMEYEPYPKILPLTAKFVFVDGEFIEVFLNGKLIQKDGSVSDRWQYVSYIYVWNKQVWPDWLHKLYKLACEDFRADIKVVA